ncbi:hypothetical protein SSS_04705 [Sarcoptes scabiei]|uniref:Uncharacterized protein n=1 Tax=Sarcoptes scabiei TaxID=52283 RepID=A0A834RIF3_SARSC|nr:hypothetical protein SSS_04705 [Sarcoptes scabiei]
MITTRIHMLLLLASVSNAQHLIVPQQFHSSAPSPTSTLGQAYQQHPSIRTSPGLVSSLNPHDVSSTIPNHSLNRQAVPVVNPAPISYGWQVQHSQPNPQPQPQPHLQPHRNHKRNIIYHLKSLDLLQNTENNQMYAAPQSAIQSPLSPVHKPAAVHYASIGENLAGDYKFGYQTGDGNSFREETRSPDGTVQGQYGFVDADGKQRVVKYTAGVGGFQNAVAPTHSSASQVAVPQWAQGHIGLAIPNAPQPVSQPHQMPQTVSQYAPVQHDSNAQAQPRTISLQSGQWSPHFG